MTKQMFFVTLLAVFISQTAFLQIEGGITVEDIWRDYKFRPNRVKGFNFLNDGKHYSRLKQDAIEQYDFVTGEWVKTILAVDEIAAVSVPEEISSYTFSADEQKVLLETEPKRIYRHSSKANFFVWDFKSKKLTELYDGGKQSSASFSPSADKVAFVYKNNLYYKDLRTNELVQITTDGKKNEVINGHPVHSSK